MITTAALCGAALTRMSCLRLIKSQLDATASRRRRAGRVLDRCSGALTHWRMKLPLHQLSRVFVLLIQAENDQLHFSSPPP